uniref:Lens epithelium-derived growth factor integrase-binding domain-containing protein n=1 Tax=Graphocephala atropunctata TaxID=36148 RepID=A0A1B6KF18_9HEMI
MDEEKPKVNPNSHEKKSVNDKEKVNNLTKKIENKSTVTSQKRGKFENLNLNINSERECKTYSERSPSQHFNMSPLIERLKTFSKENYATNLPDSDTSDSDCEKSSTNGVKARKRRRDKISLIETSCNDEAEPREIIGSVGASKLNYDIKIDPNVVDRYTNTRIELPPGVVMPPPESPETKRRRIEMIARHGRLHPANQKYNQGPVVNPPLMSPGVLVGYTPGGQRHEVDLNFERPTWFNSEYARMQFDDATRINVSRMFHDLETGQFLPDNLDPNVERRYFAEQALVSADATKHFEQFKDGPSVESAASADTTFEEHMSVLETERHILELNRFAVVRLLDFSGQVATRLTSALTLNLTPLMIKKNPVIIETLEMLSQQSFYLHVVPPARALLDKIKKLFEVPKGQTFKEYFASEMENFIYKTRNMSPFDILMMTEEPDEEVSDSDTVEEELQGEIVPRESNEETNDEWVAVEDEEICVDEDDNSTQTGNWTQSNASNVLNSSAVWTYNSENEDETDDEEDAWTETYVSDQSESESSESELDDVVEPLILAVHEE